MKGIFDVRPLVAFAERGGLATADDDYVPALSAILMLHAHDLWRRLGTFDELDADADGVLTRDEVGAALARDSGRDPSPILLDNVMAALDADHSGTISRAEFANR